jgi:predicted transposase YdaD
VPAAAWLAGGLGLVPLAPVGDVQESELPAVIARMKQRFEQEADPKQTGDLWSAVYILMGMCYADAFIENLLEGVIAMEESVTYQKIIRKGEAKGKAEGKAEEARRILLLQGRHRFGEPSGEVVATLEALTDVEKLEALTVRMLEATSWQDLLS